MAIIKLRDVEVMRLNNSGNGVQVAEKFQVKGVDRQTRYTLWFNDPSGLSVGDVVSVSGFLGTKVGDPWTGQDGQERRSVELSLNSPRIETGDGSQGAQRGTSNGAGAPVVDGRAPAPVNAPQTGAQGFEPFSDTEPF